MSTFYPGRTGRLKRELTPLEILFVKEALEGMFLVDYTESGTPFAIGARHAGNLFSELVTESPDGDGAIYMLA
jgi:hypothetical protein